MKIASTFKCCRKTCQKSTHGTQSSAWLMLGVQSMMSYHWDKRSVCHPWANQRLGRTWLGSGEFYDFKNSNKTQISEKELFLCSSTTLGKTGLLFAQ